MVLMGVLRLRHEGLLWSEVGDEAVLLDITSATYFTATGAGPFLLAHLAGGATEESLAQRLMEQYEVAPDAAKADVAEFIEQLKAHHMLENTA